MQSKGIVLLLLLVGAGFCTTSLLPFQGAGIYNGASLVNNGDITVWLSNSPTCSPAFYNNTFTNVVSSGHFFVYLNTTLNLSQIYYYYYLVNGQVTNASICTPFPSPVGDIVATTGAGIGNCPDGFAVQNTTAGGVQCINVSSSGTGANGMSTNVSVVNNGNGTYTWMFYYSNGTNYYNFTTSNLTGAPGPTGPAGRRGRQALLALPEQT